jgi:hypothetical protein
MLAKVHKKLHIHSFLYKKSANMANLSLRFVSKRGTFCMETEGVLYGNGRRFGPKWETFWPKMECVLPQNGGANILG